jgi:hypothetical protein
MTQKQIFWLILVIFLAIFFRFYQIESLPGGLFPDEAANGLDINLMQQGHLQPFYERGNGREALFFYMLWGSVELFGKGPFQHHIISALVGVLAVIFCFALTKRLFSLDALNAATEEVAERIRHRATNIALTSAFLMAVSTWHTVLSRTAFRANLIPLFASLTFYFLVITYEKFKLNQTKKVFAFSVLTGAAFALGFYSYIAYRIMVPLLGILIFWPWLFHQPFKQLKLWWKPLAVALIAFCLVIAPLAYYFYSHPGSFVGRSGQVSIFNSELYTINGQKIPNPPPTKDVLIAAGEVLKLSLLAYFTEGDLNWRHNISGYPFLSNLISPFFALGLAAATLLAAWYMLCPRKRARFWKYALLSGWFWAMLLPVVTTAEGIPHGLRAIGTIPSVFIFTGLGLYVTGELLVKLYRKIMSIEEPQAVWLGAFGRTTHNDPHVFIPPNKNYTWGLKLFKVGAAAFALTLISQAYLAYFVKAANSPEYQYSFRADLTKVSQYLLGRCDKNSTYLVLDKFSVQTTDYLTSDQHGNFSQLCNVPYKQVDPENAWELSGLKPGDHIVFTQSSIFDIKKFKAYHPTAKLIREERNKFGQAVLAVYEIY